MTRKLLKWPSKKGSSFFEARYKFDINDCAAQKQGFAVFLTWMIRCWNSCSFSFLQFYDSSFQLAGIWFDRKKIPNHKADKMNDSGKSLKMPVIRICAGCHQKRWEGIDVCLIPIGGIVVRRRAQNLTVVGSISVLATFEHSIIGQSVKTNCASSQAGI